MSFINHSEEENMSVQTTLPISSSKTKSLDNINYMDDDLNSYGSPSHFQRGGRDYVKVTVPILSDEYNFVYERFDKCLGDTNALMREFLEECINNSINSMMDESTFREEISLPELTMEKLNGMMYYYETIDGDYHPISLDDFIILMVDELFELRKESYKESGEKLSQIVESVVQ